MINYVCASGSALFFEFAEDEVCPLFLLPLLFLGFVLEGSQMTHTLNSTSPNLTNLKNAIYVELT